MLAPHLESINVRNKRSLNYICIYAELLTERLVWCMWTSGESGLDEESWAGAPTSTTSWFQTVPLPPRRRRLLGLTPTCIADCDTPRRVPGRTRTHRYCYHHSSSAVEITEARRRHFDSPHHVEILHRHWRWCHWLTLSCTFDFESKTWMRNIFTQYNTTIH